MNVKREHLKEYREHFYQHLKEREIEISEFLREVESIAPIDEYYNTLFHNVRRYWEEGNDLIYYDDIREFIVNIEGEKIVKLWSSDVDEMYYHYMTQVTLEELGAL